MNDRSMTDDAMRGAGLADLVIKRSCDRIIWEQGGHGLHLDVSVAVINSAGLVAMIIHDHHEVWKSAASPGQRHEINCIGVHCALDRAHLCLLADDADLTITKDDRVRSRWNKAFKFGDIHSSSLVSSVESASGFSRTHWSAAARASRRRRSAYSRIRSRSCLAFCAGVSLRGCPLICPSLVGSLGDQIL